MSRQAKKSKEQNYGQGSVQSTKAVRFILHNIPGKKNRLKSSRKKRNNKCAKSSNSLAFVSFNDLHTCKPITQRNLRRLRTPMSFNQPLIPVVSLFDQ